MVSTHTEIVDGIKRVVLSSGHICQNWFQEVLSEHRVDV